MPDAKPTSPIFLFCAAAPSDMALLAQWETHLLPLQQRGQIAVWSELHLTPGTSRMEQTALHLDQAQVIIFLLSVDFFASDECMALVERAQTCSAHVIPLLARPVDWKTSKLGDLACLPADGSFVTTSSNQDDALHTCVHELRRLLGLAASVPPQGRKGTSTVAQQNRERMLRRLRRSYTEMMSQTLQGVVWLELGLASRPDAVQNAMQVLLRINGSAEQLLPLGTSIIQVYDEAEHELLILGEPGAGKSTLLLDLAKRLVERTQHDEAHPLPVILPLSTWAQTRPKLEDWIAEQVGQIYNVPSLVSTEWVQDGSILPLLDGLDEVEEAARPACIDAINSYHRNHLAPLVVCSRTTEYEAATSRHRLALQGAVVVQPLTHEAVDASLREMGKPLSALRRVLTTDSALAEIATTPLVVHILILTYQGTKVGRFSLQNVQLQQQIWSDYVARMVGHREGKTSLSQTRSFLGWLAHQMRNHGDTDFYLEHLQPDWLTEKHQHTYAWFGVRIPAMIIGALVCIILGWFFSSAQISGPYLVPGWPKITGWQEIIRDILLGGLLGMLLSPNTPSASSPTESSMWDRKAPSLRISILIGVLIGISVGLSAGATLKQRLVFGLIYGIFLIFGTYLLQEVILSYTRRTPSRMQHSSKRTALALIIQRLHLRRTLFIILIIGLIYMMAHWLFYQLGYGLSTSLNAGRDYHMIAGLSFGASLGLSAGLSFGLASILISVILEHLQETIHLRERVSFSWRNLSKHLFDSTHLYPSLMVTGTLVFYFVLVAELDYGPSQQQSVMLSFGISFGLCFGLLCWLLLGLYKNIGQERIENKDRRVPNEGIKRSIYNSVILSPIAGILIAGTEILAFGLGFGLDATLHSGLSNGINLGLSYGLEQGPTPFWPIFIASTILIWIIMGGMMVWRHYLIRFLLQQAQNFPWQAISFLEEAKMCILLKRIGGGYSCIHHLLLDFLADTYRDERNN